MYNLYIKTLMPKVIITFQDNNIYFGELSTKNPDLLFISIQNGIRIDFVIHMEVGDKIHMYHTTTVLENMKKIF